MNAWAVMFSTCLYMNIFNQLFALLWPLYIWKRECDRLIANSDYRQEHSIRPTIKRSKMNLSIISSPCWCCFVCICCFVFLPECSCEIDLWCISHYPLHPRLSISNLSDFWASCFFGISCASHIFFPSNSFIFVFTICCCERDYSHGIIRRSS